MNKRIIYVIAFSGGIDSFVTTHMLLNKYGKQAEFYLVNFDINSEQTIPQKHASKLLYNWLKEQFPNSVIEYIQSKVRIQSDVVNTLHAGNEQSGLPFYFGSRNSVYAALLMGIGEAIARAKNLDKAYVEIRPVLGIHRHTTYRQYWDTTPAFAAVIRQLASLNDMYTVRPEFPIITMEKSQILEYVWLHKLPYKYTWTCYKPEKVRETDTEVVFRPCQKCQACVERQKAIENKIPGINNYELTVPKSVTHTDSRIDSTIEAEGRRADTKSQKRKKKKKSRIELSVLQDKQTDEAGELSSTNNE